SAAAILLADSDGMLRYMVSTTQKAEILEEVSSANDDDPCQQCFRTGNPVVAAGLKGSGSRWPKFRARAAARGYDAVHVLPLRFRNDRIGALKLLFARSESLPPGNAMLVQAVADILTISLLQNRTVQQAQALNNQLEGALTSRVLIEQAKGAFAHHKGISVDEAFDLLRKYARHHQLRLAGVCQDVINTPTLINTIAAFTE